MVEAGVPAGLGLDGVLERTIATQRDILVRVGLRVRMEDLPVSWAEDWATETEVIVAVGSHGVDKGRNEGAAVAEEREGEEAEYRGARASNQGGKPASFFLKEAATRVNDALSCMPIRRPLTWR